MCLIAHPALAAGDCEEVGVKTPPARFDPLWPEKPIRYHLTPRADIQDVCKRYVPVRGALDGCAMIGPNHCDIYLDKDLAYSQKFWCLVRHEVAHCKGWPASHPD